MVISLYASVRSPPATRKFSTGNAAGNLQANSNLSPPARNRSRSRSPVAQRKSNGHNISPEPSQVSHAIKSDRKDLQKKKLYYSTDNWKDVFDGIAESLASLNVAESTSLDRHPKETKFFGDSASFKYTHIICSDSIRWTRKCFNNKRGEDWKRHQWRRRQQVREYQW